MKFIEGFLRLQAVLSVWLPIVQWSQGSLKFFFGGYEFRLPISSVKLTFIEVFFLWVSVAHNSGLSSILEIMLPGVEVTLVYWRLLEFMMPRVKWCRSFVEYYRPRWVIFEILMSYKSVKPRVDEEVLLVDYGLLFCFFSTVQSTLNAWWLAHLWVIFEFWSWLLIYELLWVFTRLRRASHY